MSLAEVRAASARPARRPLAGVAKIVRLNWSTYAAAFVVAAAALAMRAALDLPTPVPEALLGAAVISLAWAVTSAGAALWIYDCSVLRGRDWLRATLPIPPRHWLNVHTGHDETSEALGLLFPGATGTTVDAFDASAPNSASIRRARARAGLAEPPPRSPGTLAAEDASTDAVFLVFSAHELRRRNARASLFRELARVLRRGGSAVVVEHGRDLANVLAFGPGVLHFRAFGEWRTLARLAGLTQDVERRITPFVRVMRFRRA
jgi:hypothetical protein